LMEQAIDLMFAELRKAEAKFPGWPEDPVHGAAIVAEEAGELVKAALDFYYGRSKWIRQMEKEAAQTAAMALRFLSDLHRHGQPAREKRGGIKLT
jgi:NTP pyrophosphatase (non-canonical NTP hydrolase)